MVPALSVDGGSLPPRATKTLVKALYDFQGQDGEDLPFRKGDILEVVNKQEEKEMDFKHTWHTGLTPRRPHYAQ